MENIKEQIKQLTDIKQLKEISEFCKKQSINLIDKKDISIEDKIREMCRIVTNVDSFIMRGGVWDDITDYIDGTPNRNEVIYYNNLIDWIDDDDNEDYDEWVKVIYEEVKNGYKGFTWDW